MAVFTVVKKIGSGQTYTTGNGWNAGAPANLTTAERSAAGTFATASYTQGEVLNFVGSGAVGKFLDTDSTGPGTGTYISYGITSGNPAASDVVTGATSLATCVLSSSTPIDIGCIWQGQINASSDSLTGTGNLITIGGSTSSSTCYKELTTAAGASWRDNNANAIRFDTSQGCYISTTGTYSDVITLTESNVHLTNLQFAATGADHTVGLRCAVTGSVLRNCIIESTAGGSAYTGAISSTTGLTMYDCFVCTRKSASAQLATMYSGYACYGCTFAVPSDLTAATGFLVTDGSFTSIMENCTVMGVTTLNQATGGITATTNITSAASPPSGWTGSVANSTANFAATTNAARNYRLVAGSALLNVGTTDSTNDGTDCFGTARPQGAAYDVGAHELLVASSALTGTVTAATEADIVAGGKTIILTLTNDTWVASGGTFDAQRANIIAGLTAASSPATGWNNVVKALQGVGGVVRTSATVVTITLDAQATYSTSANEVITVTIPSTALTGGVAIVATPTFTVTDSAGGVVSNPLYGAFNPTRGYIL